MKFVGKIIVGAAAVFAVSTAASAQVRTVGPAVPYLATGRSVSVPPYHKADQQSLDQTGPRDGASQDAGRAGPTADQPAPAR